MALFGISKAEAQKMIDASIAVEKAERQQADATNGGNIDAERDVRFASDLSLDRRIKVLEGVTVPPPTEVTAQLTVTRVVNINDDLAEVRLTLQYTPPNAATSVICSDPVAVSSDGGKTWAVPRDETIFTVTFFMRATFDGQEATAQAQASIDAKPSAPATAYNLDVTAAQFTLHNAQTLRLDGDHLSNWGHPNEGGSFYVNAVQNTQVHMFFDYVLAREGNGTADRDVVGELTAKFPPTCDLWSAPTRAWTTVPVEFVLQPGDTNIAVDVPADSPDWSNWLDLYSVRLSTDHPITRVG